MISDLYVLRSLIPRHKYNFRAQHLFRCLSLLLEGKTISSVLESVDFGDEMGRESGILYNGYVNIEDDTNGVGCKRLGVN